jgi:DNA-directed RNA polymerase subunit RPC12/RpoP
MGQRKLILAGVAAVLIVVAVVYTVARPSISADLPTEIKPSCACLACRQHVRIAVKVTAPKPYECPSCGERAAYPLFVCRECGKYFVPDLVHHGDSELPSLPVVPACPACGSTRVGNYTGSETIPPEELVLPPWPQ